MDSELLKLRSCVYYIHIISHAQVGRTTLCGSRQVSSSHNLYFFSRSVGVNLPGFHIASSRNRIAVSRASGRFVPPVRRSLVDVPYSVEFKFTNVGTDFGLTGGMMFHISSTRYPYEYEFDNDGG